MDTSRLTRGEMIAAISAVALFLIMFIFTWFSLDVPGVSLSGIDTGANAWQAFGFIDIVLFVTIVVAIGGAIITANATAIDTPVAISSITTGLGILSVLLILFRILSPPDGGAGDLVDVSRGIGVYLGLIAAAGIAYGGWAAMKEEGASFGDIGNRGGGAPPSA